MCFYRPLAIALCFSLFSPLSSLLCFAQPTYKLDVRANLKPQATLEFDGASVKRSDVRDDPGFRLQFHFKKDGKTVAVVEARAEPKVEVPVKEPGGYTVVLEVFYPAYKGGTQQKGEYKPISNVLSYRVEPGPKVVPVPKP